jgi:hypothetical protein
VKHNFHITVPAAVIESFVFLFIIGFDIGNSMPAELAGFMGHDPLRMLIVINSGLFKDQSYFQQHFSDLAHGLN